MLPFELKRKFKMVNKRRVHDPLDKLQLWEMAQSSLSHKSKRHTCTHARKHPNTRTHTHTHTHTRTHTHTHTHTKTNTHT